jgi:U3 small nucleolar RNA-associated protein 14
MFDLFGNNNRKSLKQMMDEINEMFGDYNPNFNSSSMEHKTETGSENGLDWEKETFTSPDGRITYIVTSSSTVPPIGNLSS